MRNYRITVKGQSYDVQVEEIGGAQPAAQSVAQPAAAMPAASSPPPVAAAASSGALTVKSPMPGTIMSFKVSQGQAVKRGDVLLILEAMKMENEIVAPQDGSVAALRAAQGQAVNTGDALVDLK